MQYIYIYIIFLFLEAQDGEKRRAENGRTEASAPTGDTSSVSLRLTACPQGEALQADVGIRPYGTRG